MPYNSPPKEPGVYFYIPHKKLWYHWTEIYKNENKNNENAEKTKPIAASQKTMAGLF